MSRTIIAVDNGVSGSLAVISDETTGILDTPVFTELGYQKEAKECTRVDFKKLRLFFMEFAGRNPHVVFERPCINPMRFATSISAARAYEASLLALTDSGITCSFETVTSSDWQKSMLPSKIKGKELKKASLQRATELFPQHAEWIRKNGDGDSLLMAAWARRTRG
jgi:hypothetical protein